MLHPAMFSVSRLKVFQFLGMFTKLVFAGVGGIGEASSAPEAFVMLLAWEMRKEVESFKPFTKLTIATFKKPLIT
jgi:hypothetical protein